jgi:predicted ATP-binding protein involved in virulence
MIGSIKLVNFKAHRDTTIPLGKLTALVGVNGAGKTSVLQALHYLSQLGEKTFIEVFTDTREPLILARKGADYFYWQVQGNQHVTSWNFSLQINNNNSSDWSSKISWLWEQDTQEVLPNLNSTLKQIVPHDIYQALCHTVYLKFDAKNLATPSYTRKQIPLLEYDGWGLASAISYLKTYEDELFEKLEDAIRQIVPFIKRIRVRKAKLQLSERRTFNLDQMKIPFDDIKEIWGDELVFDMIGANEIPAHAVSEGTILVLGLLTILISPHHTDLILLDDVEQALHPKAQRMFMHVVKGLLHENATLQVVMATHSPYIIDELDTSEVCVMATDQEGVVMTRQLNQHPNAEQAIGILTTGEFLSAEGEDWVIQQ